jgi:hypothetical protein
MEEAIARRSAGRQGRSILDLAVVAIIKSCLRPANRISLASGEAKMRGA